MPDLDRRTLLTLLASTGVAAVHTARLGARAQSTTPGKPFRIDEIGRASCRERV